MTTRRKLLGAATLGVAGAALSACGGSGAESGDGPSAPAIKKSKKRLTMVTTWPKGLPGLGTAAERVAEQVLAQTDGSIEIRVRAAGEEVPALESLRFVPPLLG